MHTLLSDAATAASCHPAPHIRDGIAHALQALEHVPKHLDTWHAELAQNQSLAACLHIAPEEIARCRQLAIELCDSGEFLLALPMAMYCASHASDEPEHSFLAGACLQRLGDSASAAHFYGVALQLNPADAAAAFRLGECLESLGQQADACHLYQWAIDLSRGNFALRTLQDMASRRLARLEAMRRR